MKNKFSLILTLLFCSLAAFSQAPTTAGSKLDSTTIYSKSMPAVVTVICAFPDGHGAQGSGVVLRADGVIATNFHVCGAAKSASVKFSNGDIYDDVSILDTDERKDIAILKIKAINLPFMTLGNSDDVKPGSPVYAIGTPRGIEGTISSGIVSGIRQGSDVLPFLSGLRVIVFTAPISHGSSGGPLIDEYGKVIRLTTWTRPDADNIYAAIPINYVAPFVGASGAGKQLARMTDADFSPASSRIGAPPPPEPTKTTGTIEDIAGTYTGAWQSRGYNVSGALVMTVKVTNGTAMVRAAFTGSEYLSEEILQTTFTPMGEGVWKMDYKGTKSKLSGTGLFKDGQFIGDWKFKKFIWTDHGDWVLSKN